MTANTKWLFRIVYKTFQSHYALVYGRSIVTIISTINVHQLVQRYEGCKGSAVKKLKNSLYYNDVVEQ